MRLVLVATFWMFASVGHGFAQVEQVREPPAEVWLSQILKEQRRSAIVGRYVAAPLSVALGGAAAIVPVAINTSVASSIAFVGSGALMLTSAIAYWAHEDPDEARRQMAIWGRSASRPSGRGCC